ncbi:SUMO-activating enzyme subunit 1 [Caerostris extrusa]|uniref:SUMO-activating enzyme subunit 1 n=1 Tax=Caerostris extrusa TaxID=172846 RepID=A0AAV4MY02_CAEEX|nr:SUMO-activating enzyme subunit 1 [Caerostris extrusa]
MGVKRNSETGEMSNSTTCDSEMEKSNDNITEDEAALYDRQIRLWGLDCQKSLREAKILIIGLNGLGAEVVKNLTLSGVKSITIMDETPVSEKDFTAQFFVAGCELGIGRAIASKTKIQELNPNVQIDIDGEPVSSKESSFFAQFTAVFATGCSLRELIKLNKICREKSVHFYCAETWGFYGYGFLDLGQKHIFARCFTTREQENVTVRERCDYCPLSPALSLKVGAGLPKKISKIYFLLHTMNFFREKHCRFPLPESRETEIKLLQDMRKFAAKTVQFEENKVSDEMLSCVFGELSPVCAAVGGIMANEIVKGISKKGETINNFLLFDGETCTGVVERISTKA